MAATLVVPPRTHFLDEDDNWLTLETDIYASEEVNRFRIYVDEGDRPAHGAFLYLEWGERKLDLLFATAPNNSGLQLATRGDAETATAYRQRLAGELRSVAEIAEDMAVEVVDDSYLTLTLSNTEPMKLVSSNDAGFTVEIDNAVPQNDYPNLSALVHVYVGSEAAPLVRLRASYGRDRKAHFNLAGLFGLSLGLPDTERLRAIVPGQYEYQRQTPEGKINYLLRFADEYGRPPRAERLQATPTYTAVAGGSAGDSPRRWGASGASQLCHAYLTRGDQQFYKPIHPEQPDWLYFYAADRILLASQTRPYIVVYYTDGTSEELPVPTSITEELVGRTLYCYPSGPLQAGINQAPSYYTKVAHSYAFQLRTSGHLVRTALYYRLLEHEYNEWTVFLAYTNGCGGIETVAMRGKQEGRYDVKRDEFRRARQRAERPNPGRFLTTANNLRPVDVEYGEIASYGEEGLASWRLRSGYYPREYVDHLRQLMLGRVWIVDVARKVFVAVNVQQDSLRLTEDDEDLHALELTVSMATPDRNAHRL